MRDENVNPMTGTNMRIAEVLAKKYGSDNPGSLYVLLSDPAFESDISKLRDKYGIKPISKKTADVAAQQYIAEHVAAKHSKSISDQSDFEKYYGEYYAAIQLICEKHDIPKLPIDLIDQYVTKGDGFLAQQYAHNLIKISMNKRTKELTIKLDARTKKRDLQDVLTVIYNAWDSHRGSISKKQPTTAANVHSQMVRHAYAHTEKETAQAFGQSEENVHKIKMRVRKQRNDLTKNNDNVL